ncbi:MAG: hypothetical protein M3P96_06880 [Actinomycetota bacterium]|nr:hypothetical protein [Actinomycetota bacterium]
MLVPGQPDRFLFLLPDARLRRLPGLGHAVVSDAPEQVAEVILDFLTDVENTSVGRGAGAER